MSVNNDYSTLWNQQLLNNANSLLGTNNKVGPLSGDLLQQWAMRGANSNAYRKLLQAQETGEIKQTKHYTDLMSDKFFNDNYDTKTSKVTKPTYTPDSASQPTVDSELTSGEILDNMRRLALAAINNPDSLNSTHYSLFEQMYNKIASNLVKTGSGTNTTEVVEDASAATVTVKNDFHLLTDDQNFTVAGSKGEKNYTFSTGSSLNDIVASINADSEETGVKATLEKNSEGVYEITFTSTDTGKDSTVRIDQNVGDLFTTAGQSISAKGTDALTKEAEEVATSDDSQAAIAAGVYTGALFSDQSFTISGVKGSKDFSFAKGTSVEDVAAAINAAAEELGVSAQVIYNGAGEAEGIGLLAEKAGSGQYIQVTQKEGDLFANAGKTVKVTGSTNNSSGGAAIQSLSDLGLVTINGKSYSFADIGPGGSASLANNPDAALAVLDQALRDIYEGRAQIKGFNPDENPMPNLVTSTPAAATNVVENGNWGSTAINNWVSKYLKEATEA